VNDLQALGLAGVAAPGPFDRVEWFTLLEEKGGRAPLVAVARDGAEFVALPLMREGASLVPLANWYSFTWRPLASEGADRKGLLEALARDLKRRCRSIVLAPLPDEDGTASHLQTSFKTCGWLTFLEQSDNNHVLPIEGRSYAEYL